MRNKSRQFRIGFAVLILLGYTAYPQERNIQDIVSAHLRLTTTRSWEALKSISMQGKMIYADKVVQYTFLSKWPGRVKIEMQDSTAHRIVYENPDEITVIEHGEVRSQARATSSLGAIHSKHHYSFALCMSDGYHSSYRYLGDTVLADGNYYRVAFKEREVPQTVVFYLDSKTYQLAYVQSTQIQYDFLIHFEDYRWVDGFLISFKETHYRHNKQYFVKTIESVSCDDLDDAAFYPE